MNFDCLYMLINHIAIMASQSDNNCTVNDLHPSLRHLLEQLADVHEYISFGQKSGNGFTPGSLEIRAFLIEEIVNFRLAPVDMNLLNRLLAERIESLRKEKGRP